MDAARAHHHRTAHRPDRLAGVRGPLDWDNRPRPDKGYRDVEPRPLPTDLPEPHALAGEVLSGRWTAPQQDDVDIAALARLLFLADGVVRRRDLGGLTVHFRSVPSAGALYPVEAYVVCADLGGLPAGVYHVEPITFALQPLRSGDWRGWLADAAADPRVAQAPATVALTGVPWRTLWKYAERGYRHLFWDAGAVAANLVETCATVGLAAPLLTGFVDAAVADLLGVAPGHAPASGGEAPLALVPVGEGAAAGAGASPAPGPPPALRLDVEPLSPRVVDEPALWEAHRAGDLATAEGVAGWRERIAAAAAVPAPPAVDADTPPAPANDTSFDDVVLRRGSTRRFSHDAVPHAALRWPLAVAGRHVAGDLAAAGRAHLDLLVAVHAVDEVEPGAYRVEDGDLVRVRAAAREETASLCLGQPLGGDAAYTVFLAADLDALDHAGDRAYRVAQLEAGVAAERLQLAAFAVGAGATGLTFFDDEVRRYFDTPAWPMLTVAVGRPTYRARPGRRPG